jgi:hypothetical protein
MSSCRGKPIASFCAIIDADHGCGAPPGLTLACVSIGPQAGSEEKGHADRASKDRGLSAGTAFAIVANVVDWPAGPIRAGTRLREDRIMFGRDLTQELEIDYAFWPISHYELDHVIDAVYGGGCRMMPIFRSRPATPTERALQPLMSPFMEITLRDELERDLSDLATAISRHGPH